MITYCSQLTCTVLGTNEKLSGRLDDLLTLKAIKGFFAMANYEKLGSER